jgi:hypothetical protein
MVEQRNDPCDRSDKNIAYNIVTNWITRSHTIWPQDVLWYQVEPVLEQTSLLNPNWHRFYIREDIFRLYLLPYFHVYDCDRIREGPYLVIPKQLLDCILTPIQKTQLPKLRRRIEHDDNANGGIQNCPLQDRIKWEFYQTFLTYTERIYLDFETNPDLLFAGAFKEQNTYVANPTESYYMDKDIIFCL